ncbi:MAG: hypothetical protein HY537_09700 [Deltaproteobacteria bacterium]|nr:hypothetical protein [Deltaproteobacteria bacterium]
MKPAFSSRRQRLGFLLCLLLIVLSPVYFRPSRKLCFEALVFNLGPIDYWYHQTFIEKKSVDILVIGASVIGAAIDPNVLRQQLHSLIGKELNVVSLAGNWAGMDFLAFRLKDFLENRKSKMLIISADDGLEQHPFFGQFVHFSDPDFVRLTRINRFFELYARNIASLPRLLRTKVRSHPLEEVFLARSAQSKMNQPDLAMKQDFAGQPLSPFDRRPPILSPSDLIIDFESGEISPEKISSKDVTPYYEFIIELCKKHGVKLVGVLVPNMDDKNPRPVVESLITPGTKIPIVSVDPKHLFGKLEKADMKKLFSDKVHFNINGSRYFTATIAPAIGKLYESANN